MEKNKKEDTIINDCIRWLKGRRVKQSLYKRRFDSKYNTILKTTKT